MGAISAMHWLRLVLTAAVLLCPLLVGGETDGKEAQSLVDDVLGSGANVSDYHLQFTTCTPVKGYDEQYYESSDDGLYTRQSYLHFRSCKNTTQSDGMFAFHFWNALMCHRVSHVVRMDDYFRSTAECVAGYCEACTYACEEAEYCNEKCIEPCESYYNLTGWYDEYLGCSGPYGASDNVNSYYYGPMCSSSGGVTMGYFLDEGCEIHAGLSSSDFNETYFLYDTPPLFDIFKFVNSTCSACSTGEFCSNIYESSFHCSDQTDAAVAVGEYATSMQSSDETEPAGKDEQMEVANRMCVETSPTKWRMEHQGRGTTGEELAFNALLIFGIAVMITGMIWFMLISYLYYTRHSFPLGGESLCSLSYESFGDKHQSEAGSTRELT